MAGKQSSLGAQRPLRLLIVEDSHADTELMVAVLKRAGYVFTFDLVDSPDQFQKHLANDYDAILCDHNLGSWTGTEALETLQRTGRAIPFIVASGTIGEEAAVEYLKQGATDYVLKDRLKRLPFVLHRALVDKEKLEENLRLQKIILCAKQEWELTFDAVPDAVMVLDAQGVVRRANRAAASLLGLSFGQLIGKPHDEVLHRTEESRDNCLFRPMMETGEHQRKDVHQSWLNKTFEVIVSPMRGANGGLSGGTLIMRDVSERLRIDEQRRQGQKMEAVGLLAGGIAHDFNNLMNVISGNAEILGAQSALTASQQREVKEIGNAVRRAAQLTSQLLAFSRRQVLQPTVLDLNLVVSDIEKMLRRLIGEDVELVTELQADLGSVRADPGQLEQVLMNLATNARDAMPEGGKLIIRTMDAELGTVDRIKYPYVKPGGYVRLSVIDTGQGITPEVRDRVFEPFFTTKEKGHGTGLGLAVAYGVVKQSGGYIWARSEPGKGACFDIYLPRAKEIPAAAEKHFETLSKEFRGTETVLVVEDEDALLHVISQFLVRSGYSVLGANHPQRALEIAERHKGSIPVVIMDTVLPGMSGPVVAEKLKRLHPEMVFLFISGYVDRPILDQVIAEQFLQKPISRALLLGKVHELLHLPEGRERSVGA